MTKSAIWLALVTWATVAGAQGVPARETGGAEPSTPSREDDDGDMRPGPRVPLGRPRDGKFPEGTPVCADCITNAGSAATVTASATSVSQLELKVTLAAKSSSTTISGITAVIDDGTRTQPLTGLSATLSQTKTYGASSLGVFASRGSWKSTTKVKVTVSYKVGSTTKPNAVFSLTPTFE